VEIREYPIRVGDNPGVSKGAPLSIDWDPINESSHLIDNYENQRGERRRGFELRINSIDREEILFNAGNSRADIQYGTKEANLVKHDRKRTVELLHLSAWEEFIEGMKRVSKKLFQRKQRKRDKEMMKIAMWNAERQRAQSALEEEMLLSALDDMSDLIEALPHDDSTVDETQGNERSSGGALAPIIIASEETDFEELKFGGE